MEFDKPLNFLIEGNIGSGKSTFLNKLTQIPMPINLIPEPVNIWTSYKGHNYLKLFYEQTDKWNFPFQQLAINTAACEYQKNQELNRVNFFERSIYSPIKIFAKHQHKIGTMTDAEYDLHEKITNDVQSWIKYDIKGIIYIKTTPEVSLHRVRSRSREEDCTLPIEYLQSLNELHDRWLLEESRIPVLVYLNDSVATVENFEQIQAVIAQWITNPINMTLDPQKY